MHIWIGGAIGAAYGKFGRHLIANDSQASAFGHMRLRFPPLRRSALKTLTYSGMHVTIAISVAHALGGSWKAALANGIIEPVVQTAACALHERASEKAERATPLVGLAGYRLDAARSVLI